MAQQPKTKARRAARTTFKKAKASGLSTQKAAAKAGKAAHQSRSASGYSK